MARRNLQHFRSESVFFLLLLKKYETQVRNGKPPFSTFISILGTNSGCKGSRVARCSLRKKYCPKRIIPTYIVLNLIPSFFSK
jgi:hypothetical protein